MQAAHREAMDGQEKAHQQYKEECERRLARIQNGADPNYKNGTPFPDQKLPESGG